MRVIAGKCKSLPLKTVDGLDTRPTTDRIKETLFNMLNPDIPGCRFLDLFAGSGGIGIEALSRGAKECVFVEMGRKQQACIRSNLSFTHLTDQACIMPMDARVAARELSNGEPFDVIFMDPPYLKNLEREILEIFSNADSVTCDTLIVVEISLKTDTSFVEELGYDLIKEKRYKTNAHLFLRKRRRGE